MNTQKLILIILFTVLYWSCGQNKTADVSKNRLETEIRNLMVEFIEEINIPGMGFGYYSDTMGTVMVAVGKSDIENKIPLKLSTHYPIQSTTKMFISILTLQLIEEGKLSLESTIDKWIDYVPNNKQITIKHLLKHTSGLNRYQANREFMEEYHSDTKKKYSRDDFIRVGIEIPNNTEDFGDFKYSNTNYLLLANIIETITQHSIGLELEQRIFRPVEMNDTYYKPERTDDTTKILKCYHNGKLVDLDKINFSSNAAGGIISTISDMLKFAHWIIDNNYQNSMTSELVDNFATNDKIFKYGLGIEVIDNMFSTSLMGHAGGNPGLIHEFYFSTETGEIFVSFFNEGNPREYFPFREELDTILQKYR